LAFDCKKTDAARDRRCKELAQLLGIREAEAGDRGLSGRLKIIAKLKAARRVEIARGRSGSWLYDVNRHLNLCAALRQEYDALAAYFAESAGEGAARKAGSSTAPISRVRPAHTEADPLTPRGEGVQASSLPIRIRTRVRQRNRL